MLSVPTATTITKLFVYIGSIGDIVLNCPQKYPSALGFHATQHTFFTVRSTIHLKPCFPPSLTYIASQVWHTRVALAHGLLWFANCYFCGCPIFRNFSRNTADLCVKLKNKMVNWESSHCGGLTRCRLAPMWPVSMWQTNTLTGSHVTGQHVTNQYLDWLQCDRSACDKPRHWLAPIRPVSMWQINPLTGSHVNGQHVTNQYLDWLPSDRSACDKPIPWLAPIRPVSMWQTKTLTCTQRLLINWVQRRFRLRKVICDNLKPCYK